MCDRASPVDAEKPDATVDDINHALPRIRNTP